MGASKGAVGTPMDEARLVIGGVAASGAETPYPVYNPARPDEVVLLAPSASLSQVDAAVGAARDAQPAWAAVPFEDRVAVLQAAGDAALASCDLETTAAGLTREHGKVLIESIFDVTAGVGMVGALAPLMAEALADRQAGNSVIEAVPHGVVAAVLPFNWPPAVMGNKILPALLAGNTVVVKPPPTCPGTVLALAAAMAAHLPPGVLNAVNGPGPGVGSALVSHSGVDMVSFTGGVGAGRAVLLACAERFRPVVVELGGNDPAIIAPDLEPSEEVAGRLIDAAFTTAGQVCMAVKRIYVPADRLKGWGDALAAVLARTVVGDGMDSEVTMGPVHTESARDRVESMIAEALASGAQVVRPARVASGAGWVVPPALAIGPDPHAALVVEEQFAPALPVLAYRSVDQAVEAANGTAFGLCASVWTGDADLAASVSSRLQAGTVWTNAHGMGAMDHLAPMGGWGQSGLGLELGVEGMAAFVRPRVLRTGTR
ncbi:MAG: aldehyde dehydrogenase family protein [Acidimicrobiales bacterium]